MPGTAAMPWKSHALPLEPDDGRLARLLDALWRAHFADVSRVNDLVAGFAYPWRRHLGRIRMSLDRQVTQITLNRLLDDPEVPEAILIAIIAHEIVHYAQGFGSPLPRAQRHAHAHDAVSHELARRGLAAYEDALERWSHEDWPGFEARTRQALRAAGTRSHQKILVPCVAAVHVVYS